jgi:hypothetical protein
MTEDDESVDHIIRRAGDWIHKERPRASFFAWPDRQLSERGIAEIFSHAVSGEPGFPLSKIRSAPKDPPDCLAIDAQGRSIALEVTELVDPNANAIAKHDRASYVVARWDGEKFAAHVRARLAAKDEKRLTDGPYAEYIVVLHCDEPELDAETVELYASESRFGPLAQISRAFLMLSYDPSRRGYPYFRLYP